MCFQNYQDYANDKTLYQSWFCNDCRSSANFARITTITLNSVFYFHLAWKITFWLSRNSREKQTFQIVKHDWDKRKAVGSAAHWAQDKRHKRRQRFAAALIREDRTDTAPSYRTECRSPFSSHVSDSNMGRNRLTFATQPDWAPVGYGKTNPSASPRTQRPFFWWDCSQGEGLQRCQWQVLGCVHLSTLGDFSHLYHRQDLLLLLPYTPEYNSISAVHGSFLRSSSSISRTTRTSFKCHEV